MRKEIVGVRIAAAVSFGVSASLLLVVSLISLLNISSLAGGERGSHSESGQGWRSLRTLRRRRAICVRDSHTVNRSFERFQYIRISIICSPTSLTLCFSSRSMPCQGNRIRGDDGCRPWLCVTAVGGRIRRTHSVSIHLCIFSACPRWLSSRPASSRAASCPTRSAH